ncbi:hypothetical protein SAMN05444336_112106 [Albimonas donghaensis]|uniref:Uncharacterized protein n=1 Tax=Albimonas donghaensis TaxID=356660 RepID=A0A1H3FGA1_9RHOB|nr:hypothetical protein [Albimonas donghaensis]SDX90072.1 hypothetical protein SAMN05444336_112106 [Albimonas donghaensis]
MQRPDIWAGWSDDVSSSHVDAGDGERFAEQERRLRVAVRRHRRAGVPSLPGPYGDAGPIGFGRGGLEAVAVETVIPDPKTGEARVHAARAVRRKGPAALDGLPKALQDAAREYAGLAEMVASVRAPGDGPRTGLGDGGAAARCEWSLKLRACEAAIGSDMALAARGVRAHADRGRRSLRVIDVVNAVALDGLTVAELLRRSGWSRGPSTRRAVLSAYLGGVERLAVLLGYISAERPLTGKSA